jgi:predicted nucleotidyltransferase
MESMKNQHGMQHTQKSEENNPNHSLAMYKRFALMAVAMFVAMYFIMYAMIDGLQNLIPNINNLYMTLLMVSAMLVIEIWIMKGMYQNKKINWAIITVSLAIGIFSWFGIREQLFVGDKEFVKGMIPHHAAAVLMSEKAKLTDPELIELQKNILETQAKEIELMKRKLKEFENK